MLRVERLKRLTRNRKTRAPQILRSLRNLKNLRPDLALKTLRKLEIYPPANDPEVSLVVF